MSRPAKAIAAVRARLHLVLSGLFLACIVVGLWWMVRGHLGPAPPEPDDLETLDPLVREVVEQGVEAVSANRHRTDLWRRLGMVYEANAIYGPAASCYERVLDRDESDAAARYRLAMTRHRVGDLDAAIDQMLLAVSVAPEHAPGRWRLGTWLLDVGRVDEAEHHLERAVELDPDDHAAWIGVVRVRLRQQRNEQAVAIIESRRLADGPYGPYAQTLLATAWRQQGDLERAAAVSLAAPEFRDRSTDEMFRFRTGLHVVRQAAAASLGSGRPEAALPLARQLVDHDPQDIDGLNMLAACHQELGEIERALGVLERALAVAPDDYRTNLNRATLELLRAPTNAQLGPALEYAERAAAARPDSGRALYVRGRLLERLGRRAQAIEVYKSAYTLDAREPDPMLRAGRLELERGLPAEARGTFTTLLADHVDQPEALLGLVEAALALGDETRALAILDALAARTDIPAARMAALRQRAVEAGR